MQCLGFCLDNLLQYLGFRHHFSVSRKSGNPVISSPNTTLGLLYACFIILWHLACLFQHVHRCILFNHFYFHFIPSVIATFPSVPTNDLKTSHENINKNLKTSTTINNNDDAYNPRHDLPENLKDISSEKAESPPQENDNFQEPQNDAPSSYNYEHDSSQHDEETGTTMILVALYPRSLPSKKLQKKIILRELVRILTQVHRKLFICFHEQ